MQSNLKKQDYVWVRWFYGANWGKLFQCPKKNMYAVIHDIYNAFSYDFWLKAEFEIIDGDEHLTMSATELRERAKR